MNFEQLEYQSNEEFDKSLEGSKHERVIHYNDIPERLTLASIFTIFLYIAATLLFGNCSGLQETIYKASSANRLYVTIEREKVSQQGIEAEEYLIVETYEGLMALTERAREAGYNCTYITERSDYYRDVLGKGDIVVVLILN